MSCLTCGTSGSCGCSSVTIPVGPAGATGPTGGIGPVGPIGPQGLTGPIGPTGPSPAKYANTFEIINFMGTAVTTIAAAAITSCNPLITCSSFSGLGCDFAISIYLKSGTQYRLVTENTTYVTSITYDTAASSLAINWATSGTFRVVIFG